jgi:prepilin-type N-terminal cleavage/methylation domain-containing protein
MKLIKGKERGFTLIELLVAIPIMALVVLGASMGIIQLVKAGHNTDHMLALRQVQNAGRWVSTDGLQAQAVEFGASSGFPLTLTWTEWVTISVTGDVHQIVYSLHDMPSGSLKQLQRQEIIRNDVSELKSDTTITVAQYIDDSATSCKESATLEAFTFEVTATVAQQTESRTYEIQSRPMG